MKLFVCKRAGCLKKATFEVRNGVNALVGLYCKTHSSEEVKKMNSDA